MKWKQIVRKDNEIFSPCIFFDIFFLWKLILNIVWKEIRGYRTMDQRYFSTKIGTYVILFQFFKQEMVIFGTMISILFLKNYF